MRHVKVLGRFPGGNPTEAFEKIIDFARYPELVDPVRTIEMDVVSDNEIVTRWSVLFRKGILNWSERDIIDREKLILGFEQLDGDFELLTGHYRVVPTPEGCDIYLESTFDFGVSSIESIVEPIAARVLKENFELVLLGLLGDSVYFPPPAEQPVENVVVRHDVLDYAETAPAGGRVMVAEGGRADA